jgi:hypothetical protein
MCSYREPCISEDSPFEITMDFATNTAADTCHGQREIFASADSITIGRIGERHGPEGRRYGTGF